MYSLNWYVVLGAIVSTVVVLIGITCCSQRNVLRKTLSWCWTTRCQKKKKTKKRNKKEDETADDDNSEKEGETIGLKAMTRADSF